MNSADVLIAGAGPAGAHLALRLVAEGFSVGLLDRATFPRRKPCGEFLSPECLHFLEELDLLAGLGDDDARSIGGMDLEGSASTAHGVFRAFGPFDVPYGGGRGVRRELLDTAAVRRAQEAGVRVLEGWSVGTVLRARSGRAIGLEATAPDGARHALSSRFVVGADGLRSRVGRSLGWTKKPKARERFALVMRYRGDFPESRAQVHFVGHDYFAVCPLGDGLLSLNLVVDRVDLQKGRAGLERLLAERLERAPRLATVLARGRRDEAPVVCGPLRSEVRRCHGPGAALVGDACGFVDPLTGEGLFFAMRGAKLLAEAIAVALREPAHETRALRRYARQRRREFGPRYTLARLLQLGLRTSRTADLLLAFLARRPMLCDLLLAWTGDYLPPAALVRPSVWRSAWSG